MRGAVRSLVELATSLSLSDDERTERCRWDESESESDEYWTAEESPSRRQRVNSFRRPSDPPRISYRRALPRLPSGNSAGSRRSSTTVSSVTSSGQSTAPSQPTPSLRSTTFSSISSIEQSTASPQLTPSRRSTTVSSVSSVERSTASPSQTPGSRRSTTLSSVSSVTTVGTQVAQRTETDRVSRRSTQSTQTTQESTRSSQVTQGDAPPHRDRHVEPEARAPVADAPAPGSEGKTYLVSTRHGVTEEYAWWRTAMATVGVPGTHQRKVRDDRLRDRVHAMIDQEPRHNVPPDHNTPETTEAEERQQAAPSSRALSLVDEARAVSRSSRLSISPPAHDNVSTVASNEMGADDSIATFSSYGSYQLEQAFQIPPCPPMLPRPPRRGRKYYVVAAGLRTGVFDDWDTVYAATWRVSCAVFKAYRLREDAENAYNRALNRGAVIQYEQRDEPEHEAPVARPRRGRNIAVPFYARGGVQPMYADAIVIFRGRGIGVYLDWIDCADLVLGVRNAVFNGFPSWDAAWNAWFDAIREDYPRIL